MSDSSSCRHHQDRFISFQSHSLVFQTCQQTPKEHKERSVLLLYFTYSKSLHLCYVWGWSWATDRQIMRNAVSGDFGRVLEGDWGRHTGRPATSGITECTLFLTQLPYDRPPRCPGLNFCQRARGKSYIWPFLAGSDKKCSRNQIPLWISKRVCGSQFTTTSRAYYQLIIWFYNVSLMMESTNKPAAITELYITCVRSRAYMPSGAFCFIYNIQTQTHTHTQMRSGPSSSLFPC